MRMLVYGISYVYCKLTMTGRLGDRNWYIVISFTFIEVRTRELCCRKDDREARYISRS